MRNVADVLRHRGAAILLAGIGFAALVMGSPMWLHGDLGGTVRSAGAVALLMAGGRVGYLSLLAEDHKYSEGSRDGFKLGRRTSRPVVVHMPRHAARDTKREQIEA